MTKSSHFEHGAAIVDEIATMALPTNEADTRLRIIDRLIFEALGWDKNEVRLEVPAPAIKTTEFIDYVLKVDDVDQVVVEAKRTGITFTLPVELNRREYSCQVLIDIVAPR